MTAGSLQKYHGLHVTVVIEVFKRSMTAELAIQRIFLGARMMFGAGRTAAFISQHGQRFTQTAPTM